MLLPSANTAAASFIHGCPVQLPHRQSENGLKCPRDLAQKYHEPMNIFGNITTETSILGVQLTISVLNSERTENK